MRRRDRLTSLALAVAVAFAPGTSRQTSPESCAQLDAASVGDPDLYCIDLLPGMGIDAGSGMARLAPPATPFGIAVTPAGEQLHDVRFNLRDLPPPSSLGNYTAYVAWATTPQMEPELRLGQVGNGQTRLGPLPFDRFLILITAETSASAVSRTGRLVLRGTSASVRMQPHDLAYLLAGMIDRGDAANARAHHGSPSAGS